MSIKKMMVAAPGMVALLWLAAATPCHAAAAQTETYGGPCDASAGVALDATTFVVGNDEDNTLRLYRRGRPDAIGSLPLSDFLGAAPKKEADIEGAAVIGSRIWWITSHSRDSKGRLATERHRIFATDVRPGEVPVLEPAGSPYTDLVRDLEAAPALKAYRLDAAARLAAEADGGLNIEGLAATPDGQLLIGFRNPLRAGRALVVALENPGEVIAGKRARLGAPVELDLGGRGIRSMERVGSSYLVVAGPTADRGSFALYRWSGLPGDAPVPVAGVNLADLRPEALFAISTPARVQLLSDDGGLQVDDAECKKLPPAQQRFRSLTVNP